MRRWLAPLALLLAGAPDARPEGGVRTPLPSVAFATTLPGVVGDVSGWQVVTGTFETDAARGDYRLYVNPAHGALYQLMRYRVELHRPGTPEEERRGGAERVAFIARPGVREPMRCWERLAGEAPPWREVLPGTPEYALEMSVLMRVLAVHRVARAATPPPP